MDDEKKIYNFLNLYGKKLSNAMIESTEAIGEIFSEMAHDHMRILTILSLIVKNHVGIVEFDVNNLESHDGSLMIEYHDKKVRITYMAEDKIKH